MKLPRSFFALALVLVLALGGCKPEEPPQTPPLPKVKPKDADLNSSELLPNASATPTAAGTRPQTPAAPPPITGQNPGLEKVEDLLPTAPPGSARTHPVDRKLTDAVHHYLEANNKLPQDFGALITAKLIKETPKPPPGKRFAIDRQNLQVVIID